MLQKTALGANPALCAAIRDALLSGHKLGLDWNCIVPGNTSADLIRHFGTTAAICATTAAECATTSADCATTSSYCATTDADCATTSAYCATTAASCATTADCCGSPYCR